MSGWAHLARRFFGSLGPGGPEPLDAVWVESILSEGELALWPRMSGPDRRHAVRVARDVQRVLGNDATPPVLAAALLHDVGKIDSDLGTFGRVVATLTIQSLGAKRVVTWREARGIRGRIARYTLHPQLGSDLLRSAGSDPLTVAWAREHHEPRAAWTVPASIAGVLHACDND